ncbi:protein tyrosine phosphatase family protein [Novosphingobium sp. JCM 18896]|uniref:protein tyrosine phosphatase family protein n=1 Tax=Novosphingobium sp. JCM 18896 TaxID=2989731 RepID=UPI00222277E6|nr:protein tyrosine phosphatase family protein [Novosphingobium sp. JCM 18896]MCW1431442.1 protein tyrosine phosphatase family protein [Novosphingobium sp. JCM 18896]
MPEDPEHIVAWQRLDARTTTSGRMTPEDVAVLAQLGVRHVINLALVDSPGALANEDALIAEHGLRYTHIPVPFDAPTEAQYQAFRAAYEANDEAVHVHCIMNWRVSAFFYRLNRENGMAEEAARAIMEQQWQPATNQQKDGPTWARFIAQGDS